MNRACLQSIPRVRGLALLTVLVGAFVVIGQTSPPASAPAATDDPTPKPPASLAAKQQTIRERIQRLESRMLQLSALLAESEPEQAERLRDALDRTGERRVKHRVEQLIALLRSQRFSDAEREQAALLSDLETVLNVLTNPVSDIEKRRQERERLEAMKRSIRALLDEQTENLYRMQQAQDAADALEQLDRWAMGLEKLTELLAALRNAAKPDGSAWAAEAQRRLEQAAREAAEKLRAAAGPAPDATPTQQAAGQAADSAGQAADAMKAAAEALDRAPSSDPGKNASADEAQRAAEENLRRAVRRLREEQERLEKTARLSEVEKAQRQTQQKAGDLHDQMQPGEDSPGAPGHEDMGRGAQQAQRAADRLGEKQPKAGAEEGRGALESFQKALDEIDDALRQVRREEMEETLAALEARFRSLLEREQSIRETVARLATFDRARWGRTEDLGRADAAREQRQAAEDAAAILRILTDEGTTIILPELLRQLSGDMLNIAERLERDDLGAETQRLINDVIDALKEIVGAIEKKREETQDAPAPGEGQPGDQTEPLLPGSAELKLLRSGQVRIHERTQRLAGEPPADAAPAGADVAAAPTAQGDRAAEFERLAQRQRELADLAQKMFERK
ncbi:MAG: hypothetical protein AB7Q17_11775 [Phycisphaerae bacterium]